jgi:hypothetical protein
MLAADIAEQVLPVYERTFPRNRCPHEAIEATRRLEAYTWYIHRWAVIDALRSPAGNRLNFGETRPAWWAARAAWAANCGYVHDCVLSAQEAGASEQDQVARLMTYL